MKMMYLRRRHPVNRHPFGRTLRQFLHSDEVFSVLDGPGCSWTEGGCWTLAEALRRWSDGQMKLYALVRMGSGVQDHVLAGYHDESVMLYVDANGIATRNDVIEIWEDWERLYGRIYTLEPFNPNNLGGMELFEGACRMTVEHLLHEFGEFDPDYFAIDWLET